MTPRTSASRAVFVLVGAAVIVAAGAFLWIETRQEERDVHAVRDILWQLERGIRSHDPSVWMRVEGRHAPGAHEPAKEAAHRDMLADFERLSHVDAFAMKDVHIDVTDDFAHAEYRVEGRPPGGAPFPRFADTHFRRGASGWEMIDHRLYDKP